MVIDGYWLLLMVGDYQLIDIDGSLWFIVLVNGGCLMLNNSQLWSSDGQ